MSPLLRAVLTFLLGCLALVICIYVFRLVLSMLALPPAIAQLTLIIVALVGLVCLVYLTVQTFRGGGPPLV